VAVDASLTTGSGFGGDAEGDTYIDIENLTGGSGDDILTGDGNVNILTGGAGNDLLAGGAGADKLYGDAGKDTVSYAGSAIAVDASLASGTGLGGDAAGDEYFDIENLIGGDGEDTLTGDGSDNVLTGGIGADSLVGGLGTDTASYFNAGSSVEASLANAAINSGEALGDTYTDIENLTGSDFDDILTGNAAANVLFGGVGSDILEGLAGGDVLDGGLGINTASYANAGSGVSASLANAGSNLGDAAGDSYINIHNLIGSAYADILTGDGNDNILTGGAGGDTLTGGAGNDTASYANAGGDVWASLSSAFIRFGDAVGDSFNGIENLTGSDYNDYLAGDSGNNILTGGLGDDTLEGQAGDDTIFAHQGHDTVLGDIGDDTIHVSADSAHLPTSISGGEGSEDSAYGDLLVLHDLSGTYDLTNLANVTSGIETLDISDGGNATALTISSQDIQSMVGDGNASELTILADSGDTLVLDLVGAETSSSAVDAGHTDYTITDGSQIALIHWVIA
jgi:Ca2+-binding RTX toxin-like protein